MSIHDVRALDLGSPHLNAAKLVLLISPAQVKTAVEFKIALLRNMCNQAKQKGHIVSELLYSGTCFQLSCVIFIFLFVCFFKCTIISVILHSSKPVSLSVAKRQSVPKALEGAPEYLNTPLRLML